jgi:hypothetical protein
MKCKKLWSLKRVLFFWVTKTYFPISHLSYPYCVFLPTLGREIKKARIWKVA